MPTTDQYVDSVIRLSGGLSADRRADLLEAVADLLDAEGDDWADNVRMSSGKDVPGKGPSDKPSNTTDDTPPERLRKAAADVRAGRDPEEAATTSRSDGS